MTRDELLAELKRLERKAAGSRKAAAAPYNAVAADAAARAYRRAHDLVSKLDTGPPLVHRLRPEETHAALCHGLKAKR